MTDWYPIEAAPKRQEVLLFTREYGLVIASTRDGAAWSSSIRTGDDDDSFYLKPSDAIGATHWMPLPEPPQS
jgi:hypothetical protein